MDFTSHPLLKCKSLTLEGAYGYGLRDFTHIPGIACALRSSPLLERLVVKLEPFKYPVSGLDQSDENYWNSNETHLSNLVSHLRTVMITGFSRRQNKPKRVLDFVEFLLKNASVLEKMVIILEDCGTDFEIKVSEKLSSFPRCSAAIIELCPKNM